MGYLQDYTTKIIRTRHIVHFNPSTTRAMDIVDDMAHVPPNAKLIEVDEEYRVSGGRRELALIFEEEVGKVEK